MERVRDPQNWSDYDEMRFEENAPLLWRKRNKVFYSSVIQQVQFRVAYIGKDIKGHGNKYYRCISVYTGGDGDDRMMNYKAFDLETIVQDCLEHSRYHIRQRKNDRAYQKIAQKVMEK